MSSIGYLLLLRLRSKNKGWCRPCTHTYFFFLIQANCQFLYQNCRYVLCTNFLINDSQNYKIVGITVREFLSVLSWKLISLLHYQSWVGFGSKHHWYIISYDDWTCVPGSFQSDCNSPESSLVEWQERQALENSDESCRCYRKNVDNIHRNICPFKPDYIGNTQTSINVE